MFWDTVPLRQSLNAYPAVGKNLSHTLNEGSTDRQSIYLDASLALCSSSSSWKSSLPMSEVWSGCWCSQSTDRANNGRFQQVMHCALIDFGNPRLHFWLDVCKGFSIMQGPASMRSSISEYDLMTPSNITRKRCSVLELSCSSTVIESKPCKWASRDLRSANFGEQQFWDALVIYYMKHIHKLNVAREHSIRWAPATVIASRTETGDSWRGRATGIWHESLHWGVPFVNDARMRLLELFWASRGPYDYGSNKLQAKLTCRSPISFCVIGNKRRNVIVLIFKELQHKSYKVPVFRRVLRGLILKWRKCKKYLLTAYCNVGNVGYEHCNILVDLQVQPSSTKTICIGHDSLIFDRACCISSWKYSIRALQQMLSWLKRRWKV